jgi:hypothetical protein
LQLLYRKVKCPLTLRLIRKWLRVPIQVNGKLVKRRKGLAQGSPLSPLLSNIMLNELDKEMERQGLRYVRYADDFSAYTKSGSAARKIGNNLFLFLKNKLKLPINRERADCKEIVRWTILRRSQVAGQGTETEESDPSGDRSGTCLPMESIPDGGMGNCPKPDSENDHYFGAIAKKRVRSVAYVLRKSCPTS